VTPSTSPQEYGARPRSQPDAVAPHLMFSVPDFCHAHSISRGTLYKLIKEGHGPAIAKVGRRTLISWEAAEEWRRRMEQEGSISPKGI
jgi:excisionase family DNA binding protein